MSSYEAPRNLEPYDQFLDAYRLDKIVYQRRNRDRALRKVNFIKVFLFKRYRAAAIKSFGSRRKRLGPVLSRMAELPLELLVEILEYLHPLDLMHFESAVPFFRWLLINVNSDCIWHSAWNNNRNADSEAKYHFPSLPAGVSARKWTNLLFGPLVCQKCGNSPAYANITWQQKCCSKCHRIWFRFSPSDTGEVRYLCKLRRDTAEAITKTAVFFYADPFDLASYCWDHQKFKISDCLEVDETLRLLGGNASEKVPKRSWILQALRAFKSSPQQGQLHALKQHAALYSNLSAEIQKEYSSNLVPGFNKQLSKFETIELIVQKMENIYPRNDIKRAIWGFKSVLQTYNGHVTQKRIRKFSLMFNYEMQCSRQYRLFSERITLRNDRLDNIIKVGYKNFRKQWPPWSWVYLPRLHLLKSLSTFKALMDRPKSEILTLEDFEQPLHHLPVVIGHWQAMNLFHLASLLPCNICRALDGQCLDFSAVHLATAVFACAGRINNGSTDSSDHMDECIIGWDSALPHFSCDQEREGRKNRVPIYLELSELGVQAATELVRLAGLDPETAMVWDMDSLDLLFSCSICKNNSVRNWRQTIAHHVKTHNSNSQRIPAFGVVGLEMATYLKVLVGPDPCIRDKSWACNHCAIHLDSFVTRKEVIDHARELHNIRRPVNNLDYIFYAHLLEKRTPHKENNYLKKGGKIPCLCLLCPSTRTKLQSLHHVTWHVQQAHDILEPIEGTHWKRVIRIVRETGGQ